MSFASAATVLKGSMAEKVADEVVDGLAELAREATHKFAKGAHGVSVIADTASKLADAAPYAHTAYTWSSFAFNTFQSSVLFGLFGYLCYKSYRAVESGRLRDSNAGLIFWCFSALMMSFKAVTDHLLLDSYMWQAFSTCFVAAPIFLGPERLYNLYIRRLMPRIEKFFSSKAATKSATTEKSDKQEKQGSTQESEEQSTAARERQTNDRTEKDTSKDKQAETEKHPKEQPHQQQQQQGTEHQQQAQADTRKFGNRDILDDIMSGPQLHSRRMGNKAGGS